MRSHVASFLQLFTVGSAVVLLSFPLLADDWPQWLGPGRDGIWREQGIVERFPTNGPPVRWRVKVGGGYSGPAVANGRVYLTDRQLAPGRQNPSDPFAQGEIPGVERVLCFQERDGKLLWKHEYECAYTVSYPAGPRATPLVDADKVYTLGAQGHLICLEGASGKVLWSRDCQKEFHASTPLWGFSAHPLIDGRKLICLVGGPGSVVLAFDKKSGRELWRALSAKEPGYCPPMIYQAGGRRQLILWHPESINSLDPETGKVFWSEPFKVQSALTIATPRLLGDDLFITTFYNGSRMFRLDRDKPAATLLWQSQKNSEKDTDKLHAIMSTPFLEDGYIYGVCSYGQLRCLKAETGERLWETCAPTTGGREARWANAFLVKHADRFFIANERGDLIIARLSPKAYQEISRAHLIEPTGEAAGRPVVWSHPAFANRSVYLRNDNELVCASLAASGSQLP